MRYTLALLACLFLASCIGAETVPVGVPVCLPPSAIKGYTDAEKAQAKAELAKLGPGSELGKILVDYAALQNAERLCGQRH